MHIYLSEGTSCVDKELERLLSNYSPSQQTIGTVKKVSTILLVGISGAGKDTIKKELLKTGHYHDIVSHTTRTPRKNGGVQEHDGVEYNFISKQTAVDMLHRKDFVEAKWVHRQNLYGTSSQEFEKCLSQNKIAIADVEVQGVEEYMKISPETVRPIFLIPPDYDVWLQRFKSRYEGQVGEGEFAGRSHTAMEEIQHILSKHYFSIVVNDNLDDTVHQVEEIANGHAQTEAALRYSSQVAVDLLNDMKQD